MFQLDSTWLALNIWMAEHGVMIAAAPLCMAQPAQSRLRQTVRGTRLETSALPRPRNVVGHTARQ